MHTVVSKIAERGPHVRKRGQKWGLGQYVSRQERNEGNRKEKNVRVMYRVAFENSTCSAEKKTGINDTIRNQCRGAWIWKEPVWTPMPRGTAIPWAWRSLPRATRLIHSATGVKQREETFHAVLAPFPLTVYARAVNSRNQNEEEFVRNMSRDVEENAVRVVRINAIIYVLHFETARDTPAEARLCRWVRAEQTFVAQQSALAWVDCVTHGRPFVCLHIASIPSPSPLPSSWFERKILAAGNSIGREQDEGRARNRRDKDLWI